ncbi:hypothetical protein [Sinobaca sp. H24]|uniref:hypothetical protein n=1 Tax=Sinobaca sp. H24 TaxID=2923376 RepID=UPI00207AD856|nr:hypothetical protein [Sinobaca sp. H24]
MIANSGRRSLDKENKILDITTENKKTILEIQNLKGVCTQYSGSMGYLKQACDEYIEIKSETGNSKIAKAQSLLNKCINSMSSNLKSHSSGDFRCAIWIKQGSVFKFRTGSIGFPDQYYGNRELEIDKSTAGRCYRKEIDLVIDDVSQDDDWSPNEDVKKIYNAMVCIYLEGFG